MKYTKDKVRDCVIWVERNGLDQHGGATINAFCQAQDISHETYMRWMAKEEFSEAIRQAKEIFKGTLVNDLVKSLKTRAVGFTSTKTKTEYVEDKNGNVKIKKRTTEEYFEKGDVNAAIFLLTNAAPEMWASTQKTELTGDMSVTKKGEQMSVEEIRAEIERLEKADE